MVVKALPDEAPDMTVSELHECVLLLLVAALRIAFDGTGLVLSEIFLRTRSPLTGEDHQVSADAMVIKGPSPGRRTVYRVPDEPLPDVTVEVLSYANSHGRGRTELEQKRDLFAEIGVSTHIEIDPDPDHPGVDVWELSGGALRLAHTSTEGYDGPALGGVRITFDEAGDLHVWLPSGREYLGPAADAATIERLSRALQERGVDPAGLEEA